MKKWMCVFSFLGLMMTGNAAYAFRGPVLTLRQLYGYAELIVVAEVVEVESIEKRGVYDSIASLRVKKWIKGKDARTVLPVWFYSYGADPPSAEYPKWETVLAFLQKDPKHNGMYITTGGAEGCKQTPAVVDAYLLRIEELKKILPIRFNESILRKYTAWLMKCVEEQSTRGEGLEDLIHFRLPKPNENTHYNVQGWQYLTENHKQQLVDVIADSSIGNWNEYNPVWHTQKMMLILAKTKKENPELLEIRKSYLEAISHPSDPISPQKHKQLCKEFVDQYQGLIEDQE